MTVDKKLKYYAKKLNQDAPDCIRPELKLELLTIWDSPLGSKLLLLK